MLPELEPIRGQLIQMREVTNEAYELVRGMLAAARPSNSTDLATALLAQAQSARNRARFKVNFTNEGQPRPLSPITQHQVLYIFQEALSNVVKHARAQRVDFKLVWTEDMLTITLTDDGCGFDPNTLLADGHFGLTIMQERAEEIKALLLITSRPAEGTELTLRLPFNVVSPPLVIENVTLSLGI
jgi:two-component system nitrate/nitrite sensor histidine kinase NarX